MVSGLPGEPVGRVRYQYDKSITSASDLFSIWSNGGGVVIAAGTQSTLLKSVGGAAFGPEGSTKPAGTNNLLSLSATGTGPPGTPLYVAGAAGTLWSYTGNIATASGAWMAENPNTTNSLYGVWVASDGAPKLVLHFRQPCRIRLWPFVG